MDNNVQTNEKKMSQVVIEQIQTMIMNGELKAGDRLPPEREMTEQFKIGRPALREALKALELLGLVERRHGLGNYITNEVGSNFFKPLSLSFKLGDGKVDEIFELRTLIEEHAVIKAAKKNDPEHVKKLQDCHEAIIKADTPEEKAQADRDFHYQIIKMCGNSLISNTFENVSYLMDSFIDQTVRMWFFGNDSQRVYEEHQAIIDAIEQGKPEQALQCLKNHFGNIDETMLHEI